MTLHELAEASGVSVSMLSSVERGVKAPTVVVLDRIAHGLGVRIGALVAMPIAGRLTERFGGGRIALAGVSLLALSTVPFAFVGAGTSIVFISLVLVASTPPASKETRMNNVLRNYT